MEGQKTETWSISVGGRSYGPYTAAQMRSFVSEGRLAPHSSVAANGEQTFRPAEEDPFLASLFRPKTPVAVSASARQNLRQPAFGRDEATGERSQFVIVTDMKSGSLAALEEEIFNFGPAFPISSQVWIVSSTASVNVLRNALVQKLGKLDALFVVDATHNKAAWFNYGPEAEARIRRIWSKVPDAMTSSRLTG